MGIKDIPDTSEKLKKWSLVSMLSYIDVLLCLKLFHQQYQDEYMVPCQDNHEVALHTINELVHAVPEAFGLKSFMRRVIFSTIEEPVRVAMVYVNSA
jgi:hypothetical protein